MKSSIRFLVSILIITFINVSSIGQTPNEMSYQAVIRDASGHLVASQSVSMQFSILQGSATGIAVYIENHSVTTNENGMISLNIGNGNAVSGTFANIDWSSGSFFIKTETDPTGGNNYTISGTNQLLSVPYALHAKTAETFTGTINETDPVFMTSQAANITSGDIGNLANLSGTNTGDQDLSGLISSEEDPIFKASPFGNLTQAEIDNWNNKLDEFIEADPVFAASLANGISATDTAYWNAKLDEFIETDPIFLAHPSAGITQQDINNWKATYIWYATNYYGYISTETDPIFGASIAKGITAADTTKWNSSSLASLDQAYDKGGAGLGRTIIADEGAFTVAGYDGIISTGTYNSANADDLPITGAGTRMIWHPKKAAFRAGYVSGNHWDTIGDYSFAVGYNTRAIGEGSVAFGSGTRAGDNAFAAGYNSRATDEGSTALGYNATASAGGATAMGENVTASGNYSMATGYYTEAKTKSAVAIGQYNVGLGSLAYSWEATESVFEIGIGTMESNRVNAMTVLKNGNVGIGVTNPSARLALLTSSGDQSAGQFLSTSTDSQSSILEVVAGGSADPTNIFHIIDSSGESPNLFKADGPSANEFIITNAGKVGIGTNSPDEKLHIAGSIKIVDGNQADGKVLTSDANGVASWETPAGASNINELTDGKTDEQNLFLGPSSGANHVTNSTSKYLKNTAVGINTLKTNVSGEYNVAFGYSTLEMNTGNGFNTAIGATVMRSSTTGDINTAIGYGAMGGNRTGSTNTATGYSALYYNIDGDYNVAFGAQSLYNTRGDNNTALGYKAGYNANGSSNLFLGSEAGSAAGEISNKLYIDNSSTSTPLIYGDFANDSLRVNGTLDVKETIKIEGGSPALGKVLTSDASGNASWENPSGAHAIGDNYGGGIVFYVYDNGQHGLIAATSDQSSSTTWHNGTGRYTGTSGDGLGAGEMNTAMIVATQIADNQTGSFAARICANYSVTVGGITYGDWYLPSKYELSLLYLQKSVVGNFSSAYYWSSTESSDGFAWFQHFGVSDQDNGSKSNTVPVRAIRAF